MTNHITEHRRGFGPGYTAVTRIEDRDNATGIAFGVLRLRAGEELAEPTERETSWLLMEGTTSVTAGNRTEQFSRGSLFDETPSCLHAAAGEHVALRALTDSEFTVYA